MGFREFSLSHRKYLDDQDPQPATMTKVAACKVGNFTPEYDLIKAVDKGK
jgi:nucleoid DNA-binding protein